MIEKITAMLNRNPTYVDGKSGFSLDISGMDLAPEKLSALIDNDSPENPNPLSKAHREMERIENGEIKNPDENRRVTHFTDRQSYPKSEIFQVVEEAAAETAGDPNIEAVVINGIGGSALGPQLLQFSVNGPYWNELTYEKRNGFPRIYFLDNTDTAGITDLKNIIVPHKTLVITISKSGGTQETHNNMTALKKIYNKAGLEFAKFAMAITMPGSKLDELAKNEGWRMIFPMADSIGGRTSETNIVGHVPAALTNIDFSSFIEGARYMDQLTRNPELAQNPAYQLAAAWYIAGSGRGDRNMVIVPYSDRLLPLSRYLQQLVMESLGKEWDRDGNQVWQGLTVYGNKGGTDAHAYIQQLQDGRDDFFATFIEPLADTETIEIESGLTMGDYLHAFKEGLTKALRDKGRKVIDIQIPEVSEYYLGMLIALYERTVAFYAELININAFHQPGVQAYKLASGEINSIHIKIQEWIASLTGQFNGTAAEAAAEIKANEYRKEVENLLNKAVCNKRVIAGRKVSRELRDNTWNFTVS